MGEGKKSSISIQEGSLSERGSIKRKKGRIQFSEVWRP